jgi:zinc finger CCCH domain-containing protein 14
MEKAKETLLSDTKLKDENVEKSPISATPPRAMSKENDEFNIPTISEIKTSGNLHKKELSQLAELQSRIYQAKKKLKELDSDDEKMLEENETKKSEEPAKPSSVISLSAIKKAEKEIYIAPSFRKLIEKQKEDNERKNRNNENIRRERNSRRSRSRSPRDKYRSRRDRERSRSPRNRKSIHQRIGSRVTATSPVKKREVPIKVAKTRPTLGSVVTKNAGKNLLLRAVAEAQKSTSISRIDQKPKRNNIVVQVPGRNDRDTRKIRFDEEYVPQAKTPTSDAEYRPTRNNNNNMITDDIDDGDVIYLTNPDEVDLDDLDRDEQRKSPQFVVTMEGMEQYERNRESHSPTPPPVIKRRRNIKDRIGTRPGTNETEIRPGFKRKPAPAAIVEEEEEHESLKAYNRAKRARVSPIKFDLTDEEDVKSHGSPTRERSRLSSEKNGDKREESINGDEQKKIKLVETTRSFDHVPACKLKLYFKSS